MLAHVPSFGRNPRGSPDFLAYPVPKACMHVLGTRVPRRLGVARSASSPKAALALGCSLTPGLRISFGRVTCMARAASVPGLWALGFLLLACVCGWVRVAIGRGFCLPLPVVAGVLGGCVWVRFVVFFLFCRLFVVFVVGLWCRPAFGSCVVSCAFPVPPTVSGSGVRCGRACWAQISAVPRPSWLGCQGVFFALFCLFFFPVAWSLCSGPCGLSPGLLSFGLGCWLFFFFVCLFRCPFSRWAAVPGLVLPVLAGWSPCACLGVLSLVPSGWGVWPPSVSLAGGLLAVGCFRAPPDPPPFFFGGGGGLAVPPFAFPWLALALWLVCGVVGPSPLLAEVPVCYSPPLLTGFRCRWWWAVPATPGWGPLAAVVCGVWCVAVVCWWGCGWCVVWLVPRHSWRRFLCATPRHSWLGFAAGGGGRLPPLLAGVRWRRCCVVCAVWRWCVGGVVAGVWCGWSVATPGGGSCVLLPATPGWVSLPVVVGGPRHSWLGSACGGGVWCVVCGGGVLVGLWLVCGVVGPSPLLAEVPVCYSPPILAGFRCRWWWAVPATPGWGPLAAVVCGVWCVAVACWWGCGWCVVWLVPRHSWRRFLCAALRHSWLGFAAGGGGRSLPLLAGVRWRRWCVLCGVLVCGGGVVLGLWLVCGVVGPSPLLAEVPVCYSPPLLAGFRCRWWWAVPATPGWGPLAAVVCGVWCVVCGGGVVFGLWLVCDVVGPSPLLAEVPVCYSPLLLAGFRCRCWWAVPATPGWGPLAAVVCGVWCVVCGVLVGSLATPGGGSCVLLPATPGWVSLPLVVGGPRHSWLGPAGGGGVWCVVCGGGVLVGLWLGAHLSIRTAAGVRVRALLGRVGRAGLPGAFWCASPFPLAALSCCFAWPPPVWGCPSLFRCCCRSPLGVFLGLPLPGSPCARASFVSPAWPLAALWWLLPRPPPLLCVAVFVAFAWFLGCFFFLFLLLLLPLCAPVVSGFLWFPAPGALGLGACVVCFVGLLLLGSPCACPSFVLSAWLLAAPWWLLPPPPPPFWSRGFRRSCLVPWFFFFFGETGLDVGDGRTYNP